MIRVGVIGLGVGINHINSIVSNKNCKLVYVCDFDEKKLKDFKIKFPKIKVTKNDKDLFQDPNIDLISIASYDNFHFKQIISSIKNKKHVFVEKPMCLNMRELNKIQSFVVEL